MVNKLIIVGNGFDLSHGLKTSYGDFITAYFQSLTSLNFEDEFYESESYRQKNIAVNSFAELTKNLSRSTAFRRSGDKVDPHSDYSDYESFFTIKNNLFHTLCQQHVERWVDIEATYYKELLSIIDSMSIIDNSREKKLAKVIRLNAEMDEISRRFELYLKDNVVPEIDTSVVPQMQHIFEAKKFKGMRDEKFIKFKKEFPSKISNKFSSFLSARADPYINHDYNNVMVLNFNYTKTLESLYDFEDNDVEFINIHGTIEDKSNPINLGFGDEKSKRYGELEDINENEYLRLMKSVAYSNTDNYRKLFDFIESGDFQIQIMGHSCGISDRTLLNAIFENHNCKSIKVFYHEWEDQEGRKKDNFSELIQNISRHFDQKLMMREKIVNKTLCQPLPQNPRK